MSINAKMQTLGAEQHAIDRGWSVPPPEATALLVRHPLHFALFKSKKKEKRVKRKEWQLNRSDYLPTGICRRTTFNTSKPALSRASSIWGDSSSTTTRSVTVPSRRLIYCPVFNGCRFSVHSFSLHHLYLFHSVWFDRVVHLVVIVNITVNSFHFHRSFSFSSLKLQWPIQQSPSVE